MNGKHCTARQRTHRPSRSCRRFWKDVSTPWQLWRRSVRDRRAEQESQLHGLPLADPDFTGSAQIDVLLGADVYSLILEDGFRKGREGEPIAQKTTLGWIVSGLATPLDRDDSQAGSGFVTLKCATEEDLTPLIRRFND